MQVNRYDQWQINKTRSKRARFGVMIFKAVKLIAFLSLVAIILRSCSSPRPPVEIVSPASENCIEQGGTLAIQNRGNGLEYGICVFDNNHQCEEWAMMRGDCPVGGVEITGYNTPASQYCVVTGGKYNIIGYSSVNNKKENGTCTFKGGKACDAWEYFNGKCGKCEK